LPEDKRKEYDELVELVADTNQYIENFISVFSVIILTSTAVATTAKFFLFATTTGLSASIRIAALGLKYSLAGNAATAAKLFLKVGRAFTMVKRLNLVSPNFLRIMNVISKTAKVIAWIGVALDALLLILSLIVGAQQKAELQEAIKDLFARRLQMKYFQLQAFVASTFTDATVEYLQTPQNIREILEPLGLPEETILQAIENSYAQQGEKIATRVSELQKEYNMESTFILLRNMDANRSSWTNEDPSYDEAMARIEALAE